MDQVHQNVSLRKMNIDALVGCNSSKTYTPCLVKHMLCYDECYATLNPSKSKSSTCDAFVEGMEREFVGRLPVRVALQALSQDDLFQVLTMLVAAACWPTAWGGSERLQVLVGQN